MDILRDMTNRESSILRMGVSESKHTQEIRRYQNMLDQEIDPIIFSK